MEENSFTFNQVPLLHWYCYPWCLSVYCELLHQKFDITIRAKST